VGHNVIQLKIVHVWPKLTPPDSNRGSRPQNRVFSAGIDYIENGEMTLKIMRFWPKSWIRSKNMSAKDDVRKTEDNCDKIKHLKMICSNDFEKIVLGVIPKKAEVRSAARA
jgi:hypothetical protein